MSAVRSALLERLLPPQLDNRFEGRRAALWLLGLLVALKLVMSINSIVNAENVAAGADGFRLESYGAEGARAVLMLFALNALGQLAITLLGVIALARYRAMVPFLFALLLAEHAARRAIVGSYAIERAGDGSIGFAINMGIAALLALGLGLSLWPRKGTSEVS